MADGLLAAGVSVDQAKALRTILSRFIKNPTPELQETSRDAIVEVAVQLVGAEHLADMIIEWCSQDPLREAQLDDHLRKIDEARAAEASREQLDLLGGGP